ncbi:hypothetical protein JTB14_036871 [Gonioctena quinquepunctata]|nr:hypothetical protein JTB14_036871 [Gonioctena quinquepunctata]
MDAEVWDTKGLTHLMICSDDNPVEIQSYMDFLWRNYQDLDYVIVLLYENLHILSYNPFKVEVKDIKQCPTCPFFTRFIDNMYGYPMRILIFEYPPVLEFSDGKWIGDDYKRIEDFAEWLNFTPEFHVPAGVTKAISSLRKNEADMCAVRIFRFDTYARAMNVIEPTYIDENKLVILVPKAELLPSYQNILYIFEGKTLVCLLICLVLISIATKFVSRIDKLDAGFAKCLLDSWRIILQSALPYIHSRPTWTGMVLLFWILFSNVLNTAIQTKMLAAFIKPNFLDDIHTLEELRKSELPIYGQALLVKAVPAEYGLGEQFEIAMASTIDAMLKKREPGAYLLKENAALMYLEFIENQYGSSYFHLIEETLVPGYDIFFFQKNSPYLPTFKRFQLLSNQMMSK